MRSFHYHMDHLGMDIPTYPNILRIIETDREARTRGTKLEGPWKDLPRNLLNLVVDNVVGKLTMPDGTGFDLKKVIVNLYVDRNNQVFAETTVKTPMMNHIERPRGTNFIASFYFDRSADELFCITNSRMLYGDLYRVNLQFTTNEDVHFFCCHEEFFSANMDFLRAHFEQRWCVPYNPTKWQFSVMPNLGQSNEHDIVVLDPHYATSVVVYGEKDEIVKIPFSVCRFQKKLFYPINCADYYIPEHTFAAQYTLSDDQMSLIFECKKYGRTEIDIIPRKRDRIFVERFVFPTTNLHLSLKVLREPHR